MSKIRKGTATLLLSAGIFVANLDQVAHAADRQEFVRMAMVSLNGLPPDRVPADLKRSFNRWFPKFKTRLEKCAHQQLLPTSVDYFDDIEFTVWPDGSISPDIRLAGQVSSGRGGGGEGADWKYSIIQQVGNSLVSYNESPAALPLPRGISTITMVCRISRNLPAPSDTSSVTAFVGPPTDLPPSEPSKSAVSQTSEATTDSATSNSQLQQLGSNSQQSQSAVLTGEVAKTTLATSAQAASEDAWSSSHTNWDCADFVLQLTRNGAVNNAGPSQDAVRSVEQDPSIHEWSRFAQEALKEKGAAYYTLTLRYDGELSLATYAAVGSPDFIRQLQDLVARLNHSQWSRTVANRMSSYYPAHSFSLSGRLGRGMICDYAPDYPDLLVR